MKPISTILTLLLMFSMALSVSAQDIETIKNSKPIQASGSLSASTTHELITDSTLADNSFYYYLNGNLTTTVYGVVSVPISFAFTDNTFTKNAALPFNRFSLSPTYKGYTLYLGYNSLTFSQYTLSGHDFLGIGAAYQNEVWDIAAFYGRLRKACAPDSAATKFDIGYKRMGGGFKIGHNFDKVTLAGNVIFIGDKSNTVSFDSHPELYIPAKENIASSIEAGTSIIPNLTLRGEYAISAIKSNYDTSTNYSTVYHAYNAALDYQLNNSTVGVAYKYLPPNYETLGGYYFSEDLQQMTATFSTSIADRVSVSGDAGFSHDNVKHQKISTNKSIVYSINVSGNPIEKLNLSASFNNDQSYINIRNNYRQLIQTSQFEDLDTNNYSQLNSTSTLSAAYTPGNSENVSHSITADFTYQTTSENQRYDTLTAKARITNLNTGYSCSLTGIGITFSIRGGFNKSQTMAQTVNIYTLSAGVSQRFKNSLSLSSDATLAQTNYDTISSYIANIRMSAAYTFFNNHNISLSGVYIHNSVSTTLKNRFTINCNYSYTFAIKRKDKTETDENNM
ncbi:MAG: hypothetical protein PUC50_05920 [Bacteroidales bacterium]|nr:hypothetical protein [Bacteroidales bacterium]